MRRAAGIFGSWTLAALAAGCGAPLDAASASQLLAPDATGWVARSTTGTTGIQGQWHASADSQFGARAGDCQTSAYGECSIVDQPAPGATFAPTPGLGMCTSGLIARWIAGSHGLTPDYSPGWAGIVLELDMPDWPQPRAATDPPIGQPYDAVAHGVTGFAFDIDSEPAPGASLLVTTVGPGESSSANPVYWGGARLDASPAHAGHNEFHWSDVGPGSFDGTRMLRVGFLVSGNDSNAVIYNFCINNLAALRSSSEVNPRSPSDDQLLVPDASGWVDRSTTGKTKIQGPWFVTSDGIGSCQAGGHADAGCSVISEPDPAAQEFPPTPGLGMCTSGVVAQAIAGADGSPDWSHIWGAEIVLALNATDFPEGRLDPFDAYLHGVTGFAFDIDSEPAPGAGIRVELQTVGTETNPASWGGATADRSPVHAGHNEFRWEDVGGPIYLVNRPRFDASKLIQIGFHVPTSEVRPVSFSFCINNLTALRH